MAQTGGVGRKGEMGGWMDEVERQKNKGYKDIKILKNARMHKFREN